MHWPSVAVWYRRVTRWIFSTVQVGMLNKTPPQHSASRSSRHLLTLSAVPFTVSHGSLSIQVSAGRMLTLTPTSSSTSYTYSTSQVRKPGSSRMDYFSRKCRNPSTADSCCIYACRASSAVTYTYTVGDKALMQSVSERPIPAGYPSYC